MEKDLIAKRARVSIVMLANAGHKPLDTRIFQKEARSLSKAGYQVSLIIPAQQSFIKEGIQIIGVKEPINGFQKLIYSPYCVFKAALKQDRRSFFHIHDSELLMMGIVLRLLGRKVIYDAHEDTPLQIDYQHWIPRLLKGPYKWLYLCLEKVSGWIFNRIIVAEPVISKYFPTGKTHLIRNFPILETFRQVPDRRDRKDNLVYIGLLSKARGVEEMLAAFSLAREKIKFNFVLGGKSAPLSLEKKLIPKYDVDFRSWVPYEKIMKLLYESRAGIIIPQPIPRYLTNYPVKLFEYMAAGLPVIASVKGEASEFVKECSGGVLVDPSNVKEIAEAIEFIFTHPDIADEMGMRGREMIFRKYNWEEEGKQLIRMYDKLSGLI